MMRSDALIPRVHFVLGFFLLIAAMFALSCSTMETPTEEKSEDAIPVVVEGAAESDEDEALVAARRELQSFRKSGRVADIADAAYSMERDLRRQGFHFAVVDFRAEPSKEKPERVALVVDEGPRVLLGEVTVTPDADVEGIEPATFFEIDAEGLLATTTVFREAQVEGRLAALEQAYLLAGHYDVEVGPMEIEFSDDKTTAKPKIPVKVGPLYTLAITPPTGPFPENVAKAFPAWPEVHGGPYHVRRPAELAAKIRSAFLDQGYHLGAVRPITRIDDETHRAHVSFDIELGPEVRLDTIEIEGVDRTCPDFLRDRFGLEPGDVLSEDKIDEAVDELYRTGLFGRVDREIKPEEEGDPRLADLLVRVEELEARSVDFELGYGSYELARGGVRYRDRNLFGAGRILEAELRASLRSGRFEVGLTDPYSLGRDNTLNIRGGVEFRQEPSFDRASAFFLASVSHEIDRFTTVTGGYRFRYSSVSNITADLPDGQTEGNSTQAGLFGNFRRDTRDNPVVPEDGEILTAGVFWSTPALLADLDFVELSVGYQSYHRLFEGTVLAWSVRLATRHILNDDSSLPIQERYFLGGESSVRSFLESELGPVDDDDDPLGGLSLAEAHIELRQQLFGSVHGALFYDIGIVNSESFDFGGPYGHAIGVGLRYLLPIGPARIDFAFNPGRRFGADGSFAVHFAFGFSF